MGVATNHAKLNYCMISLLKTVTRCIVVSNDGRASHAYLALHFMKRETEDPGPYHLYIPSPKITLCLSFWLTVFSIKVTAHKFGKQEIERR